jgi:hypothetical protein
MSLNVESDKFLVPPSLQHSVAMSRPAVLPRRKLPHHHFANYRTAIVTTQHRNAAIPVTQHRNLAIVVAQHRTVAIATMSPSL